MSDPNMNGQHGGDNGNANGQPEYGAYAPQGQSSGQYYPYGGAPNGNDRSGANGQPSGQYQPNNQSGNPYANGQPYGQPFAYQPYGGQPGAQGQPGGWQPVNAFKLIEEMLPQQAKNAVRGLYGIVGAAAVILGLALLIWPGKTLTVFAVALGIYFVVSGVIRIVSALVTIGLPGGWRVLDVLVGILLAFGGVVMLKNAALSGTSLAIFVTLIVGFGWIMEGVMALAESWRLPKSGWAVCYAIISIIAGVVLLFSPVSSMMFLIIFGGCALIVMGVSAIVRAFTFGKPRK
ncbi:HdeD family acid-resistance protein [Bifidobacterium sp. SO1]|uniref:HdeD family acid-resistance protein n=1 Tax=Bifidobacterium sp. SO1 TaxID=2809029 RepID=UPI001BDDBE1C|nr:HdeD family acid-resistance protein [Bifidobacterium sp. SO1]MBT1160987.1 DUF308 domain-containing protein [Bifidobacterium sp. SO1]